MTSKVLVLVSLIEMSLFGSSAAPASNPNPAQGDTSKDVAVKDPPEDSISDIRFSPVAEYLAVASWDKKVRIYEIDQQGQSKGLAFFEHQGPVLSCAWSKVKAVLDEAPLIHQLTSVYRMERKSSALERTKLQGCLISMRRRLPLNKLQLMTIRYDVSRCFRQMAITCL